MTRRRVRSVVLALFLLSFAGPWGSQGSDGDRASIRFWDLVAGALNARSFLLVQLLAAAIAVPATCLVTILTPRSRPWAIAHRALAVAIGAFAAVVISMTVVAEGPPPWQEIVEGWGATLYLGALALALVVEVIPARHVPKRDFADVFR